MTEQERLTIGPEEMMPDEPGARVMVAIEQMVEELEPEPAKGEEARAKDGQD